MYPIEHNNVHIFYFIIFFYFKHNGMSSIKKRLQFPYQGPHLAYQFTLLTFFSSL